MVVTCGSNNGLGPNIHTFWHIPVPAKNVRNIQTSFCFSIALQLPSRRLHLFLPHQHPHSVRPYVNDGVAFIACQRRHRADGAGALQLYDRRAPKAWRALTSTLPRMLMTLKRKHSTTKITIWWPEISILCAYTIVVNIKIDSLKQFFWLAMLGACLKNKLFDF